VRTTPLIVSADVSPPGLPASGAVERQPFVGASQRAELVGRADDAVQLRHECATDATTLKFAADAPDGTFATSTIVQMKVMIEPSVGSV
jgi:hypothetical protein